MKINLSPNIAAAGTAMGHVRLFFRWPSRAVVRQEFPRLGKNLKKVPCKCLE